MYRYQVQDFEDSGSGIKDQQEAKSSFEGKLKVGAAVLSVVILSAIGTTMHHTISSGKTYNSAGGNLAMFDSENSNNAAATATANDINFTFKRSNYDPVPYFEPKYNDNILNYKFLEPYTGIMEPHAPMELHVYQSNNDYYEFKVCPEGSQHDSNCQSGSVYQKKGTLDSVSTVVQFSCNPYDKFDVTVTQFDAMKKTFVKEAHAKLLCLYVRREIRSLTDEDREAYVAASATTYLTSEEEGREKYGENFHSSSYMLMFHHFNAALRDQDHIHEGNGFLLQHLKMTNYFDDSIKSINPSVSLPYWDFTMDNELNLTAANSYPINEKWFGSMTIPSDMQSGYTYKSDKIADARIKDGAFEGLLAEKVTNDAFPKNGYGYLRAPWNLNPSPYISRYTFDFMHSVLLPTCDTHSEILDYDDMMDFFFKIAFGPHATVHTLVGGFYGCDMFEPLVEQGYINSKDDANAICSKWIFFLKEFWRYGYITPRSNCVADVNSLESSTCGFDCTAGAEDSITNRLFAQIGGQADTSKDGASEAWTNFICAGSSAEGAGDGGRVFSGDHLESASPADPSFWPMHPTLERLLQAKLMAGGFKNEQWATDEVNEYVCDKPMCYSDETGERDYYDDCCYGHFEHDRLLDGVSGDRYTYVGASNAEALAAADPRSAAYSNPYVYDKFSWDHCTKNDIEAQLNALYSEMQNTASPSSSSSSPSTSSPVKPSDSAKHVKKGSNSQRETKMMKNQKLLSNREK